MTVYRYRSAVTGRFVKAGYAKRYPKRTVRERIKKPMGPWGAAIAAAAGLK